MGLYLYCLVPLIGTSPRSQAGIDGAPVQMLEEDDLRVWCSEMASAPVPSLDRIREHHAVVRAAMEAHDSVLPMRFGQWFATRDRLRERLQERGIRYAERLQAVSGAHEFGVRVTDPDAAAPPAIEGKASSGREHLERLARNEGARRELEKWGERVADDLRKRTKGLLRDERVQTSQGEWGIVSVAHLVDRDRAGSYRDAVSLFQAERSELTVHLSGPWPPYSFAE